MTEPVGPYGRDRLVDKPGIVGARWWHDALADQDAQIARRVAIRNILIAGGLIAGFGAMLAMCIKVAESDSTPAGGLASDYSSGRQTSLEMQKAYGWSFGANTEPLVFNGESMEPFKPDAIAVLRTDLMPRSASAIRYAISTLFDSPHAYPTKFASLDQDEQAGFQTLDKVLKPIYTPAMDIAYAKGKALAELFAASPGARAALVVDLNGPSAVAFAAGAADFFEPVFLFDNWPHPRGVVHAHETLSAAIYYQPRFRSTQKAGRPAMFVLDRNRLSTYTDDATQFDNRWVAKMPGNQIDLKSFDAVHVLYVCPEGTKSPYELDDLNDDFVRYVGGGVDVRALSLELLAQEPGGSDPNYYYGGSHLSHHAFFVDYPWAKPFGSASSRPLVNLGRTYVPTARTTTYREANRQQTGFGTVPVVVLVASGAILGARYSRSGSWNRSSSSWGGG